MYDKCIMNLSKQIMTNNVMLFLVLKVKIIIAITLAIYQ